MWHKRFEAYLVLGLYFAIGLIFGYFLHQDRPANNNIITVDVVKNGGEIDIYEHYSKRLVFEYNKNKEADKTAFEEYSELLKELTIK